MNTPKVSVIMPSLNVVSYIRECIESVINQTLKEIEIICVDAGSTDGTLDILREYAAKDSRIQLIISDKKSYGYQMNLGLDAAKGKYLGIVETDDFVPRDMYEQLFVLAEKNSVDFIKADFYRFTVNSDKSLNLKYNQLSPDLSYYHKVLKPSDMLETFKFIMNTWSGIYNIEFLRRWNIRHNETPGASYQDNGFWFQTFCRAKRAYFLNKPLYMNRRDNPNSSVYSKSKVYCVRDEFDYIRGIIEADSICLSRFLPLCNFFRFSGYYYNTLYRVSPEFRKEFLFYFSTEFKNLANNGELDKKLFSPTEWNNLMQIMYAPEEVYSFMCRQSLQVLDSSHNYLDVPDNQKTPLISVIVPVYNVESYLAECIESLLNQTLKDIEIICINDGSTDTSSTILSEYANRDSRISIHYQRNKGLSSARNVGLIYATGEYVCFVDSDDGLAPNALKKIYETATKKDADIVVFGFQSGYYPVYGNIPTWIESKNPIRNIVYPQFEPNVLFNEHGAKPFVWRNCFRRRFLKENQLFFWEACLFGEDSVFQIQAFPKAKNVTFIKDRLYYYRCSRPHSLMSAHNQNPLIKIRCHIQIVSYLNIVLRKEGELQKMKFQFAGWALSFVYGEWELISEHEKPALAKDFLTVFNKILNEEQKKMLGSNNQSRLSEFEKSSANLEMVTYKSILSPGQFLERNTCSSPKITFIVPVYNMERYICRCLQSLLYQSLDEIEVICVNDASTDNTGLILNEIAKRDKRLTIITHAENCTANQSRKEAVLAARGEYVLFCDADDMYRLDAAEKLYAEMRSKPVDIIHFGVNVVNCGGSEDDKAWLDANLLPYFGELHGQAVFDGCFREHLFGYTLVNKMYETTFAQKAFTRVQDGQFPRGQDLYAFVLLCYFAKSYRGVVGQPFYQYNLGLGGDGTLSLTSKQFARFCSLSKVYAAIEKFFIEEGTVDKYQDVLDDIHSRLIGDCINKWHHKVSAHDKGECFDLLLQVWPDWKIVESIARRYWSRQDQAIQNLENSQLKKMAKSYVKVIGMYYHKLVGGGVERVIEFLTPLLISLGYQVVIITDIQGTEDNIPLPEGVKRYMIPNEGLGRPEKYHQRARQISDVIHAENIDVMIYHAWNTAMLAWDMLTIKAAGTAFMVHCHSVFSMRLLSSSDYFAIMPKVYSFADAITCLSEVDRHYWKNFNSNTFTVLNPPTFDILKSNTATLTEKNVLWVARLSPEKRPEDALRIFKKVYEKIPDSQLKILGTAEDVVVDRLQALAKQMQIPVDFLGFQEDISPFFLHASVFLSTSEYEGFGLNLFESKIFGVPIVMYDLPYLTLLQDNRGIFSVDLGDIDGAANHLIKLLTDDKLRQQAGQEARAHALELANYDYSGIWQNIISSVAFPRIDAQKDMAEVVMWETLLKHYAYGVKNQNIASSITHTKTQNNTTQRKGIFRIWPIRKIKALIRCYKENGLHYTLEHLKVYIIKIQSMGFKAIRCYKENGMKYTIRRIKEKIQ